MLVDISAAEGRSAVTDTDPRLGLPRDWGFGKKWPCVTLLGPATLVLSSFSCGLEVSSRARAWH